LNKETTDTILIGLEKTACLIDRCAVYEILYLNIETAASKNLEKTLLQLYTAILSTSPKVSNVQRVNIAVITGCAVAN